MDEEIRRIRREKWLRAQPSNSEGEKTEDGEISRGSSSGSSSGSKRKARTEKKDLGGVIDLTDDSPQKQENPQNKKTKTTQLRKAEPKAPLFSSFSVASYNVWFGPPHPTERMERIASLLLTADRSKPSPPLFVGFQEVTDELALALHPPLREAGYRLLSQDRAGLGYGCALAVRTQSAEEEPCAQIIASGFLPYRDTLMGRGLLWLHARHKTSSATEFFFGTTHLESYMPNYPAPGSTYSGATQREMQICQATHFCEQYLQKHTNISAAIILGDFNWDDERKRSSAANSPLLSLLNQQNWSDAWLETRQHQHTKKQTKAIRNHDDGYTYDSKLNAMLRGSLRRRFDRCIGYFPSNATTEKQSETSKFSFREASIFGTDPIQGLEWRKQTRTNVITLPVLPSDHFGLSAYVQADQNRPIETPTSSPESSLK